MAATKKKLRSIITAPKDHYLLQVDFSQAETWIVAYLSGDEKMKKYLATGDIHSETAFILHHPPSDCEHKWKSQGSNKLCVNCNTLIEYEQRNLGKRSNHGLGYRMHHLRFAQILNKEGLSITNADAERYQNIWTSYYSAVPKWWATIEWKLEHFNRTLTTTYGRKRTFFQQWGMELFKEATAYEPQSTVGDHANGVIHPELGIPGGFLEVHKQVGRGKPCHIINVSHDSCILEVPKSIISEISERVVSILQRPIVVNGEQFTIPVDAEYGERWGEWEKG